MPKFRKKPIAVEAYRTDREVLIETTEGDMLGRPGDWIITGIKGERYPCQHEVFRESYDPADLEAEEYYRDVTSAKRLDHAIADRAVAVLNRVLEVDHEAVQAFVGREIVCRPSVKGEPFEDAADGGRRLKLLGLINAIVGTELVRSVVDDDGQVVGFERSLP